jgi:hypothetical protein
MDERLDVGTLLSNAFAEVNFDAKLTHLPAFTPMQGTVVSDEILFERHNHSEPPKKVA